MEEFPSQEGDRVGAGYPHVERVKVTATPGRGWFRDSTFVIYGGGFSWRFSRPLKKDGEHGRLRRTRELVAYKANLHDTLCSQDIVLTTGGH